MTPKQEFIGDYLNLKMKDHGLPYGMQYINLLSRMEEEAETKWKEKNKKKRFNSINK